MKTAYKWSLLLVAVSPVLLVGLSLILTAILAPIFLATEVQPLWALLYLASPALGWFGVKVIVSLYEPMLESIARRLGI